MDFFDFFDFFISVIQSWFQGENGKSQNDLKKVKKETDNSAKYTGGKKMERGYDGRRKDFSNSEGNMPGQGESNEHNNNLSKRNYSQNGINSKEKQATEKSYGSCSCMVDSSSTLPKEDGDNKGEIEYSETNDIKNESVKTPENEDAISTEKKGVDSQSEKELNNDNVSEIVIGIKQEIEAKFKNMATIDTVNGIASEIKREIEVKLENMATKDTVNGIVSEVKREIEAKHENIATKDIVNGIVSEIKQEIEAKHENMATEDTVNGIVSEIKREIEVKLENMATKDTVNEKVSSIKSELEDTISKAKTDIEDKLENMATKDDTGKLLDELENIKTVTTGISTMLGEVPTKNYLDTVLSSIKDSVAEMVEGQITQKLDDIKGLIEGSHQKEIGLLNDKIKDLEKEKVDIEKEKDKEKEKALNELKESLAAEKNTEIEKINKQNRKALEDLQSDFNKQKEIYENLIEDLKSQKAKLDAEMTQGKNAEDERNQPYVSLLEKIVNCESLNEFSENKGLKDIYSSYSPDTPEKIREFISLIGNEYGFVNEICNALKKFKKASAVPAPITNDEKAMIEEVNKFYRKRDGRDSSEELLYLPKGFTYDTVTGAQVPFYEPDMQDIKDAFQNRFEYITDVYTPCFRKFGTNSTQIKAMVKGRLKG